MVISHFTYMHFLSKTLNLVKNQHCQSECFYMIFKVYRWMVKLYRIYVFITSCQTQSLDTQNIAFTNKIIVTQIKNCTQRKMSSFPPISQIHWSFFILFFLVNLYRYSKALFIQTHYIFLLKLRSYKWVNLMKVFGPKTIRF